MSDIDRCEPVGLEFLAFDEGIEISTQVDNEISKVVWLMESILNSSSDLTWDDFYKIYGQWYELHDLVNGWLDIWELKIFDAFCEVTKSILARPVEVTDAHGFVRMIPFILALNNLQNWSDLIKQFQGYLPHIPQETINAARDLWKQKMMSSSSDESSSDPYIFFSWRRDSFDSYPDLTCLRFFYQRATDDSVVNEWTERFSQWIPGHCWVLEY